MSMVEYVRAERQGITDDQGAERAIQKIMEAQRSTEKWKAHFEQQLAGIKRRNDETIARMEAYLEAYFDTVPHKVTSTQESYALPSAKLVRKAQQPLYIRDDKRLLQWLANSAPDMVRTNQEPNWAELKKHIVPSRGLAVFAKTGEIIEGVAIEAREPKFAISLTEE